MSPRESLLGSLLDAAKALQRAHAAAQAEGLLDLAVQLRISGWTVAEALAIVARGEIVTEAPREGITS